MRSSSSTCFCFRDSASAWVASSLASLEDSCSSLRSMFSILRSRFSSFWSAADTKIFGGVTRPNGPNFSSHRHGRRADCGRAG